MSLIQIDNLSKRLKILNHHEGLSRIFRFTFAYVIPIGFGAFYLSQIFLCPDQVSPPLCLSMFIGIGSSPFPIGTRRKASILILE